MIFQKCELYSIEGNGEIVIGKHTLIQKEAVGHYFDTSYRCKLVGTEYNHEKSSAKLCWY